MKKMKIIKKYLMNNKIIIRFTSMLILGAVIFTIFWFISYYTLPKGLLRGKTISSEIVGVTEKTNFYSEWFKITGYNLMVALVIILLNLILWLETLPLGYILPYANIILYSIFLGTNSFSIPMPERMAPSFEIFLRAGPYEMMGFLLIAAATYNQSRFALVKEPYRINSVPKLLLEQWIG